MTTLNFYCRDPMGYDYQAPANSKPFFVDFDDQDNKKNEQRFCRFYRSNGWCSKKDNCRFIHVQTGSSFFEDELDQSLTIAHHEVALPNVGDTIAVNMHVVRSPSCFYISLKPFDLENETTMLIKLNKKMTDWLVSQVCLKTLRLLVPH